MNSDAPVKSIIISGNSKNQIIYKLYPDTEFSQGVWYISIPTVAYSSKVPVKQMCSVSCNLVKSQRIKNNYEVECYEQPFGIFMLESTSEKITNFSNNWLYINALSNELKITIQELGTNEILKADCDFHIHLLFKRIK